MTTLYDPTIIINNRQIFIKANSGELIEGLGEVTVTALSAGGGVTKTQHAEDISTKVSHLKFKMENSDENIELKRGWKVLVGLNKITIHDKKFTGSIRNCSLTNDPNSMFNTEGEMDFEFKGDVVING